jgi:murein DD-endopeptidase MepM/ murein hydrolase activator NlpD
MVAVLLAIGATRVAGQISLPLDVRIPQRPSPVAADGKIHLAYELHLTNFGRRSLTLTRVDAVGQDSASPLVTYSGNELSDNLRRPGLERGDSAPETIGAGLRAVLFMWIAIDEGDPIPTRIAHHVGVRSEGSEGEIREGVVTTEPLAPGPAASVIGPPLRGEDWFAANGPDNATGHRRALIPVGGLARIAQRFAIDWVQIRDGATHRGDSENNANYYAWGQDAIAVADGIVASVKDDIPENVPGIDSRAVPITLETVGGNYVILDIGDGRYAFYAHLQPGSLRMAPGDRVRRGQVLGLVGNSGNSTEPHLHFHLADANSALGAEGLPFVFDSFEYTGRTTGFGDPFTDATPQSRVREIPLANWRVNFP